MDVIQGLFEGFNDYIFEKSSMEFGPELAITYTPYSYDLIDADLDFDEIYYSHHLIPNFEKLLDTEIMNYLKTHALHTRIVLRKGKMVFRTQIDKDSETIYDLDPSTKRVHVCATSFRIV